MAELYLRDQLSKDSKVNTLEDIPWHFEQQPWQDENNTHAERGHNRQTQPKPGSLALKPFVKVTMHSDKLSETNNDNTMDDSKNSPV